MTPAEVRLLLDVMAMPIDAFGIEVANQLRIECAKLPPLDRIQIAEAALALGTRGRVALSLAQRARCRVLAKRLLRTLPSEFAAVVEILMEHAQWIQREDYRAEGIEVTS